MSSSPARRRPADAGLARDHSVPGCGRRAGAGLEQARFQEADIAPEAVYRMTFSHMPIWRTRLLHHLRVARLQLAQDLK